MAALSLPKTTPLWRWEPGKTSGSGARFQWMLPTLAADLQMTATIKVSRYDSCTPNPSAVTALTSSCWAIAIPRVVFIRSMRWHTKISKATNTPTKRMVDAKMSRLCRATTTCVTASAGDFKSTFLNHWVITGHSMFQAASKLTGKPARTTHGIRPDMPAAGAGSATHFRCRGANPSGSPIAIALWPLTFRCHLAPCWGMAIRAPAPSITLTPLLLPVTTQMAMLPCKQVSAEHYLKTETSITASLKATATLTDTAEVPRLTGRLPTAHWGLATTTTATNMTTTGRLLAAWWVTQMASRLASRLVTPTC